MNRWAPLFKILELLRPVDLPPDSLFHGVSDDFPVLNGSGVLDVDLGIRK